VGVTQSRFNKEELMGLFKKATKTQLRARIALIGPSGTGKTYSALKIAEGLGERIAVLDTERGSASKYAGDVADFDVVELETFPMDAYIRVIEAAGKEGYDVLIIDSLSHAWVGKGGALDEVDKRSGGKGGKFAGWKHVTPKHQALIDAILSAPMHVIATMRSKTEYAMDKEGGKTVVRKVGMGAVQRDGMEYEFDLVGELDQQHNLTITKSRCAALDEQVIHKPGADLAQELRVWLGDGAEGREDPTLKPAEAPRHELVAWLEGLCEQAKAGEVDAASARERVFAKSEPLIALAKKDKEPAFAALKKLVELVGEDPQQAGAWVTEAPSGAGEEEAAE
jgi:hypothetical protein